jgi:hypothetical protein
MNVLEEAKLSTEGVGADKKQRLNLKLEESKITFFGSQNGYYWLISCKMNKYILRTSKKIKKKKKWHSL